MLLPAPRLGGHGLFSRENSLLPLLPKCENEQGGENCVQRLSAQERNGCSKYQEASSPVLLAFVCCLFKVRKIISLLVTMLSKLFKA